MKCCWMQSSTPLRMLLFMLIVTAVAAKEENRTETGLKIPITGCLYDSYRSTVFCRHTDGSTIQEWLSTNSTPAAEVNIHGCDIKVLANIFSSNSLHPSSISVRNSQLQSVLQSTFHGQHATLMSLDLSGNHLNSIPRAIENLTQLQWLNLRENDVHFLPESSVFFRLFKLKGLDLSFNYLGKIEDLLRGRREGLSLAVFNFEAIRESLEYLNLRANQLRSFPDQFTRPFFRLKHLDLSYNRFSAIPQKAFSGMKELQTLLLDNNNLKELTLQELPPSINTLSLQGNPLHCSCQIRWLWQHEQSPVAKQHARLQLPSCASPFIYRGVQLNNITEMELCRGNVSSGLQPRFMIVGDDTLGQQEFPADALNLLKLTKLKASTSSGTITMEWRVDPSFHLGYMDWAVVYRQLDSAARRHFIISQLSLQRLVEEKQWNHNQQKFSGVLAGLMQRTPYVVCLAAAQRNVYFIIYDNCREVITGGPAISQTHTQVVSNSINVLPEEPSQPKASKREDSDEEEEPFQRGLKKILFKPKMNSITINWEVENPKKSSGEKPDNTYKRDRLFPSLHYKVAQGDGGVISLTKYTNNGRPQASARRQDQVLQQQMVWRITYREFGSDNETEVVIMEGNSARGNQTLRYVIEGLDAHTPYIVCFQPLRPGSLLTSSGHIETSEDKENSHCQELMTLPGPLFPVTEVAVATTVSTSTTAVVVALVCCFCPGCLKCKRKKKKKKKEEDKQEAPKQNGYLKHKDSPTSDATDTSSVLNSYQTDIFNFQKNQDININPKPAVNCLNETGPIKSTYVCKNENGYLTPIERSKTCNGMSEDIEKNYKATMLYIQQNNITKIRPEEEKRIYNKQKANMADTHKGRYGYDVPKNPGATSRKSPLKVNGDGYYVVPKPSLSCSDLANFTEDDKSEYSNYFWNTMGRTPSTRRARSVSPKKNIDSGHEEPEFYDSGESTPTRLRDPVRVIHTNKDKPTTVRAMKSRKKARERQKSGPPQAYNTWTSPVLMSNSSSGYGSPVVTTSGGVLVETHPGYLVPRPPYRSIFATHSYRV